MSNELKEITLLSGIAIIIIVVYHSLETFNSYEALLLKGTLRINELGLFLFTFLSGYKIALNHTSELEDKQFLKKYYFKRFYRIYKPYIGYSLMIIIPEFILMYIAIHYLKLDYSASVHGGINIILDSINVVGLIKLVLGDNFIAPHLWYLFVLLIITSICFFILYWGSIRYLYVISFLVYCYYFNHIKDIPYIDNRAIYYFPAFVFGIFLACHQKNTYMKKIVMISPILLIILMLLIFNPHNYVNNYYLTAYGFILPCLLISLSSILIKIKLINKMLYFCGRYSFQIYLFQLPFIVHFFQLFSINPIFKSYFVNTSSIIYDIFPYILSIFIIVASVYIYKISCKLKLNLLFE